jgi:Domain of unknown function (DUF5671)
MILRRLYLYLVSAAALATLAIGLSLLGATALLFVFNDPQAPYSRGALAGYTAATLVGLPVWAVHFWFARRFAHRDPAERASVIRRLYVYWACLGTSIAAMYILSFTIGNLLRPIIDTCLAATGPNQVVTYTGCGASPDWLFITQGAWALLVLLVIWAFHLRIATRDRAVVGEQGGSATLRRWYMYIALLVGLLTMLNGAQNLIAEAWLKARDSSLPAFGSMADAGGQLVAGLALWGIHARLVSTIYVDDDRKSTLRALEGFIAVAVCMAVALVGASQILYYALARALGINNPGNVGNDVLGSLAGPASLLVVYGVAWFSIRRRLSRDTGSHEVDRQAGIRRLYTNLAGLVSVAALAIGAAGVLWNLAEQIEARLIGVTAADWKDPISLWFTLFVVGAAVWLAHWRHAPWPGDRQSLSRRLYVWATLLASVLAVLGSSIALLNVVLRQVFSANPKLSSPDNLDFGHFLAVLVVAIIVGIYHWRVLRADAASRPARPAPEVAPAMQPVAVPSAAAAPTAAGAPIAAAHGKRYVLSVVDASEDDVHQALANLPPQASYHLTPEPDA